jgi:hypothetical protein
LRYASGQHQRAKADCQDPPHIHDFPGGGSG